MKWNWIVIAGLLSSLLITSCADQLKSDKPLNVIIIFADDMGYGDLGSFGNPTIKTPNLDQLAVEGQKWTEFYVASPVCTPSRAALLTGRYPIRNGMTSHKRSVLFPNSAKGLPPSEITIAEVLKQKEYTTATIGKWHLGHLPEFLPTNQGFDYYYGIPYSNDMKFTGDWNERNKQLEDPNFLSDYQSYDVPLMENETIIERPANQNTITKRYTEKAIEFIQQNKDKPFFLYLAHSLPHIPLFAHPDRVGNSKRGLYGDVVEEIDWSVGEIIKSLKDLQIDEQTLVVFTSDNGPWLLFKSHGGSSGPLRGGKGTTFEGGQRVPTVFWSPGLVKPGVVNEMGSTLDLINTVASLTDTELPNDRKMDGYDLSPVLKGIAPESPRNDFYYWSTNADLYAVRSGDWKLHFQIAEPVIYWNKTEPLEYPELYNVNTDISELYNLADSNQHIVKQLTDLTIAHKNDLTDSLPDNLAAIIEE
ncbi:MAG: arylsulfatase [Flammeovirgaceae bacterium]|nr:arylsulfatase [Flammeovirgaceae bacterium]MBE60796.1 arylsulfatase [Flammeovirgaceae bacterium]MBR07356.1 arylsulfatase [Rickettsiales bacterium]HCX24510.1 arylsulfatase [Cytophagales bacterium]|tara:strand:- start:1782 stop:3206 length:1425 start_codon:yes stop_codon:yes gene_type:complete